MTEHGEVVGGNTLLARLHGGHTQGATGVLEYEIAGRPRRLLLRNGAVVLPADSALAAEVRRLAAEGSNARWEPLLARLAGRLAEEANARCAPLRRLAQEPADTAGPVPTWALLRRVHALAAPAQSPPAASLVAEGEDPPPAAGPPCWTQEERWVLERLRIATPYAVLESECPFQVEELRQVVAGLRGVGIVRAPDEAPTLAHDSGLLKLVDMLRARIGASLRERPLGLLDDALQRRLETLARRASTMGHYELLGVEPAADESEIQAAFERLARLVHPSHAERPGVQLSPAELSGLFERAVAAMRTLGDPLLRASYDTGHGVSRVTEQDSSDRRLEVAELARRAFDQASYEERNGDLHSALVLYERAAALAPRAEHWLALARLQAKNPSWSSRTLESYRRALELDPTAATEISFEMGGVLERAGSLDEAVSYYQRAAAARPPHPAAIEAMDRLAERGHGTRASAGRGLGRLFRRS
jgi:tetratricopeptide (TPR) repeat protein